MLVVGGGPVGLTAALALARAGISVHLVDRESGASPSLAATFHPPTLEILAGLGVDLTDIGLRAGTIEHRDAAGKHSVVFDLAELAVETRFPYRLHVPQAQVCSMLRAELAKTSAQCSYGVEASLEWADRFDLLIAADGAHSGLRTSSGLTFDGHDHAGTVIRLHCDPTAFDQWHPVTYIYDELTSVSVLRLTHETRIIMRPDPTDDRSQRERAETATGVPLVVRDTTQYTSSARVVSAPMAGNVVFVGDSAHVTGTRGGMNMNAGIHDAAAVAAAIIDDPESLPQVARARAEVAREKLVPRTQASLANPAQRLRSLMELASDPSRRRQFLRQSAMLDMVTRAEAGRF